MSDAGPPQGAKAPAGGGAAPEATSVGAKSFAIKLIAAQASLVRLGGRFDAQNPPPSPCVAICRMNADSGLCEGCFRTLPEIASWSRMDAGAKLQVWDALAERAKKVLP